MAASAALAVDARPHVFHELDTVRVRSGLTAEEFALLLHDYAYEKFPDRDGNKVARRTQSAPGILTPRTDRSDSVPVVKSLDSPGRPPRTRKWRSISVLFAKTNPSP